MRKLEEKKEPLGERIREGWQKTERKTHQIAKNAKIGEDEPIAGGPGEAGEAGGPGGAGGEGGEGGLAGGAGDEAEEGKAGAGGEAGGGGGGGGRQAQGQGSRRISDSPRVT
jgi:hypothetical protein